MTTKTRSRVSKADRSLAVAETQTNLRGEFVEKIRECWFAAVRSIIDAGQLLIEAKGQLDHGEFLLMIDTDLPFGARTAQMLMQIASHEVLANTKYYFALPPAWGTLVHLARLEPDRCRALIEDKSINPEMTQEDARALVKPPEQDKADHDQQSDADDDNDDADDDDDDENDDDDDEQDGESEPEAKTEPEAKKETFFCSFCAKSQYEVSQLAVSGFGGVHICNECVDSCVTLFATPPAAEATPKPIPDQTPDEIIKHCVFYVGRGVRAAIAKLDSSKIAVLVDDLKKAITAAVEEFSAREVAADHWTEGATDTH
jgi:ClpX C4-type zinc finger